tara:strand:+ start:9097 stop:10320 length:1224 start_codon:yes stop_codon:yes gene_type:complete
MLNQVRKYYFYLLIINITLAANGWSFLGISIGQLFYWLLLFLGVKVLFKTGYSKLSLFLLCLTLILKIFSAFLGIVFTGFMSEFTSGLIFILVGASLYAENPNIIYRQLISFFALSIPFMILQKIGVHTFFYGWNTELFHKNFNYSFDEVKDLGVIFKNIPLFPTLFVQFKDLTYAMYQGRPTGLLYSNNVLSVIISLALALHFSIYHKINRNFKNIIIAAITVLTMSTLVYGVLVILFIYYYYINKNKNLKSNGLKTFFLTSVMLIFHYIFFPGLTVSSIGLINIISFVTRFAEIFNVFGLNYFDDFIVLQNLGIDFNDKDQSFSLIGALLKNRFSFIFLIFSLLIMKIYYKNLKKFQRPVIIYTSLFFVCIMTQFAVNFLKAPTFQLFFGIALFPIFKSKILRLK